MNEVLAIVDTKVDSISDITEHIKHNVNLVGRNVVTVNNKVTHLDGEISQLQCQMQKGQDGVRYCFHLLGLFPYGLTDKMLMHVIPWLTDLNFKSVQAEKLSQRVGDTGRWFLESKQFLKWVDNSASSSCLWCPGHRELFAKCFHCLQANISSAGVGKTILASIIIDYLQSLDYKEKTLILSIFCDYKLATAQTIANLFCSLLKQLVQDHGLSGPITLLYNQCLRDGTRPSLNALTKIISQELESFHRVYIVLDALDEFPDDNGGQEKLINTTRSLGDNIYLLVTSRNISTIGLLFEEDTRLDIRAADDDINLYIMSKLSCGRLARLIKGRDNLRQAILDGVTEKADGMCVTHTVLLVESID